MASVMVTAEWALWGKKAGDIGYHQLDCSAGKISSENFDQVITRYSPGTPESLPQVTISWLSDKSQVNYLAIAIHDRVHPAGRPSPRPGAAEPAPFDAHGRETVRTSYYCVPFADVAEHGVSYQVMYDAFRAEPLPRDLREPVTVKLAAGPDSSAAAPAEFALRVAALLLAGKPVCMLGAGHLTVTERLGFLDTVASLLPYGARTRLSASTWTSSTYQNHRFRLFFAGQARNRDDHVVMWDQAGTVPVTDPVVGAYLAWLGPDPQRRVAQLARALQPMGFTRSGAALMLARIGAAEEQTLAQLPGRPPTGGSPDLTVADLLVSCGERLEAGEPEQELLKADITELALRLGEERTDAERQEYQDIIRDHDLLREHLQVLVTTRAQFYDILLGLAFASPLSYADYCGIEDCANLQPGQVPHRSLLAAIGKRDLTGPPMRQLLQLLRECEPSVTTGGRLSNADLVALAADPALQPGHAQLTYEALAGHPDAGGSGLRRALRQHGYLAAALEQRHRTDPGYQVLVLCDLLQLAYGPSLDRPAVREVLRNDPHQGTAALDAAVLISAEGYDEVRPRLTGLLLGEPPALPAAPPASRRPAVRVPAIMSRTAKAQPGTPPAAHAPPVPALPAPAPATKTPVAAKAPVAAKTPARGGEEPATSPEDPRAYFASLQPHRAKHSRRGRRVRLAVSAAVLMVLVALLTAFALYIWR
jgi:hypothetical protein